MSGRSTCASLAAEAATTQLETIDVRLQRTEETQERMAQELLECLNSCALPKRLASARHTRSASVPPPLRRPLQQRLLPPRPHHRPLVWGGGLLPNKSSRTIPRLKSDWAECPFA
jgi:hypothetical protein